MATLDQWNVPVPYSTWGTWPGDIATSVSGSNVNCSLRTFSFECILNWEMRLQRQASDGTWKTIGTRTGYVTHESPSHRTFTGVASTSSKMKVFVVFSYIDSLGHAANIQSSYFYV